MKRSARDNADGTRALHDSEAEGLRVERDCPLEVRDLISNDRGIAIWNEWLGHARAYPLPETPALKVNKPSPSMLASDTAHAFRGRSGDAAGRQQHVYHCPMSLRSLELVGIALTLACGNDQGAARQETGAARPASGRTGPTTAEAPVVDPWSSPPPPAPSAPIGDQAATASNTEGKTAAFDSTPTYKSYFVVDGVCLGALELEITSASGTRDGKLVRRELGRNLHALVKCFEAAFATPPEVTVTVTAEFVIGSDGAVKRAKSDSTPARAATCITAAIKTIEFPKPADGHEVHAIQRFSYGKRKTSCDTKEM
jgi:hypothetical protein